ncbi:MAG TPA: hypothetical protein VIV60_00595 [Polyangiaceae bacterium]
MDRFMRHLPALVLVAAAAGSVGCFHHRVAAPHVANFNEPVSVTKWSLFWGLAQSAAEDSSCRCLNGGLKEVTASTNYGYLLLGVASLGVAVPTQLEYVCGKPAPGAAWPTPPSPGECSDIVVLAPPPISVSKTRESKVGTTSEALTTSHNGSSNPPAIDPPLSPSVTPPAPSASAPFIVNDPDAGSF